MIMEYFPLLLSFYGLELHIKCNTIYKTPYIYIYIYNVTIYGEKKKPIKRCLISELKEN